MDWLPTSTRTPTMTAFALVFVTSRLKPLGYNKNIRMRIKNE